VTTLHVCMLAADGTLKVLVGRMSLSDAMTNAAQPVLIFTDSTGYISTYVSTHFCNQY